MIQTSDAETDYNAEAPRPLAVMPAVGTGNRSACHHTMQRVGWNLSALRFDGIARVANVRVGVAGRVEDEHTEARGVWDEAGKPPGYRPPGGMASGLAYLTISLSALSGSTLTTLRAGLALNTVGSPVKGLMPLRARVAGLRTTLSFIMPGTVNTPMPLRLT